MFLNKQNSQNSPDEHNHGLVIQIFFGKKLNTKKHTKSQQGFVGSVE